MKPRSRMARVDAQVRAACALNRLSILAVVLTIVVAGCTQPGRLLVVVESDITDLDVVTLRLRRSSAAEGEVTDFVLSRDPLPLRLGVEPVGGSGLVRIEAVGRVLGGTPVVESDATINVVPGPTRVWRLFLDRACRGVFVCADDETCVAGECEPVPMVEPEELPLLGVDAGAPRLDAGFDALIDAPADARVAEVCNGFDDDSDGTIDEGFAVGTTCDGADLDQCLEGTLRCSGLEDVVCDDETGSASEACNALDDDCDGATDEALTQACSDYCGAGTQTCRAGSWGECAVCPAGWDAGCAFAGSCTFSTGCSGTYHCCNNVGSATNCPAGQVFRTYSNCSRTPCTRYNLCCAN